MYVFFMQEASWMASSMLIIPPLAKFGGIA